METYNTNKAFKSYVDKYCKEYGLTVAEALQHSIVQEVEKQKPMKPLEFDGHWYKCPKCGKYAGGLKGNYCHSCGQAIDWSDL